MSTSGRSTNLAEQPSKSRPARSARTRPAPECGPERATRRPASDPEPSKTAGPTDPPLVKLLFAFTLGADGGFGHYVLLRTAANTTRRAFAGPRRASPGNSTSQLPRLALPPCHCCSFSASPRTHRARRGLVVVPSASSGSTRSPASGHTWCTSSQLSSLPLDRRPPREGSRDPPWSKYELGWHVFPTADQHDAIAAVELALAEAE